MSTYRVGIIGCGQRRESGKATGAAIGHSHAYGYEQTPETEIVALADIRLENARAFQQEHGGERLYTDYKEMLAKEELDIVSVCVWPFLHPEMVYAAAECGVKAIHCEKPMALTFGEARRMVAVCEEHGVQLTIDHQRRFGQPFQLAKQMLEAGAIGELVRLEAITSNLYDWGTHWFDMMNYYNNDCPVQWVMGQADPRGGREIFGAYVEGQGMSYFRYQNGVYGMMVTGEDAGWGEAANRLVGTEGIIEVGVSAEVPLRIWGKGQREWSPIRVDGGIHGPELFACAIQHLVRCLETGEEPLISGRRALQAAELIFATYESSRIRGRVDLPLGIDDSPLLSLLESETEGAYGEL